jgi:hypothetical protein
MGFLERRAPRFRAARDRFGPKPGPDNGGPNQPVPAPAAGRRISPGPAGRAPGSGDRPEVSDLLGRTVLAARTQRLCRDYGLIPRSGTALGSGLSRSYRSLDAGVEIAADAHGTITTVFLHFHGDDGFASYRGEIPGGGAVPRRAALWASLGRPDESGEAYREPFLGDYGPWDRWVLPGLVLHAQYALDGDRLHRITLTRPDPGTPQAA